MSHLAERAHAIAAQARSAADARGSTKAPKDAEPVGSGSPARSWWTVHHWGGVPALTVLVVPPMTYAEVRERFYPEAAGVIALGA